MPDVSGFDVVEELGKYPETKDIPILVLTAKQVTAANRAALKGDATTILEKTDLNHDRFTTEVRRAISTRKVED